MNTPNNHPGYQLAENNEKYSAIGEELFLRLYTLPLPPQPNKIEFKGDFSKTHHIPDYYDDAVREAFQSRILSERGIKVRYSQDQSYGDHPFNLSILDYDLQNGYGIVLAKHHLNNAISFIVSELKKNGEVVFDQYLGRPPFFKQMVSRLLGYIGYTATFRSANSKEKIYFEPCDRKEELVYIAEAITDLQSLKDILDEQQSHKTAAEGVETEFSRNAIQKLEQADFGIIAVSQDMMNDPGFLSLLAAIKNLKKNGKTIVLFELDKVPSDLGIDTILPSKFMPTLGNTPRRGLDSTTLSNILQDGDGLRYKKSLYGNNQTTALISYNEQDKQHPFIKNIKLNMPQVMMLKCKIVE